MIERWWYSQHKPPVGGTPPGGLPRGAGVFRGGSGQLPVQRRVPGHLPPPADITPFASLALKGEGVWHPTGRTVKAIPAMYTTSLRPGASTPAWSRGVAWMHTKLLRAVLVAGTQEPGGGGWPWGAEVPPSQALGEGPLLALTGRTITTVSGIEQELKRIQRVGFAVEDQEAIVGEGALAAPVFDNRGAAAGGIGVTGPVERMVPKGPDSSLVVVVREVARGLSRELGAGRATARAAGV